MATFKKCSRCRLVKAISEFSINRATRDGLDYYCKRCNCEKVKAHTEKVKHTPEFKEKKKKRGQTPQARAYQKAYREKNHEQILEATRKWREEGIKSKVEVEEKRCRKCNQIKSKANFTPRKDSKDRLDSWCKECMAARMWQHRQKEEVRRRIREWNKSEAGKASTRKYQESAKGKISRTKRDVLRKRRLEDVICTLTATEWEEIIDDNLNRCFYCKREFGRNLKATLDHRKAVARGGDHTRENVIPACGYCNSSKAAGDLPVTNPDGTLYHPDWYTNNFPRQKMLFE